MEWAKHNISVNGICPGYFKTVLTADLFRDEERAKWVLSKIPLGRTGVPEELAGFFLASETLDYITGHTINVDGGKVIQITRNQPADIGTSGPIIHWIKENETEIFKKTYNFLWPGICYP